MSDGSYSNGSIAVDHLIDDPIGAHAKRSQSSKPTAKKMTRMRIALQQAERFLNCVNQWPIQTEKLTPRAPGKYDTRHRSATRSKLLKFVSKLLERDNFASRELRQACLKREHRIRIREDLRRLLEGLVLIDRYKCGSRPAVAGHEYVVPPIGHVVQHLAELGSELSRWDRPCRHGKSVRDCVHLV
jgi:hypothetical protein